MKNYKDYSLLKSKIWFFNWLLFLIGEAMARSDIDSIADFAIYFFIAGTTTFICLILAALLLMIKNCKYLNQFFT